MIARTQEAAARAISDAVPTVLGSSRKFPAGRATRHAELAYAGTAHVVTGTTAPPGHKPYQQAAPEAVLAGILQRDAEDLSATEQIRQAQDWAGGTGHLLTLWSAAVRQTLHPDIDEQIKVRLTGSEAWRYDREHARTALQGQRARTAASPDVSRQLRLTAQAEADAHRQAADVQTRHDHTGAAIALAARLAGERQLLEAASARYELWSADTRAIRDAAGKAAAELQRRGHAQPESQPQQRPDNEPQQMTGWWHQLERIPRP